MSTYKQAKERRKWLLSHGICTECGHEDVEPGKTKCWECLEKHRLGNKRRRQDPEYRKIEIAKQTEKYNQLKAEGICPYCRKRPAKKDRVYCEYCAPKVNTRKHGAGYIPRSERPGFGMCYYCGEPVLEGKKICEKHYKQIIYAGQCKKKADNSNHIWRTLNKRDFNSKKEITA